jgi:hypothetical protein
MKNINKMDSNKRITSLKLNPNYLGFKMENQNNTPKSKK